MRLSTTEGTHLLFSHPFTFQTLSSFHYFNSCRSVSKAVNGGVTITGERIHSDLSEKARFPFQNILCETAGREATRKTDTKHKQVNVLILFYFEGVKLNDILTHIVIIIKSSSPCLIMVSPTSMLSTYTQTGGTLQAQQCIKTTSSSFALMCCLFCATTQCVIAFFTRLCNNT